MAKGNHRKDAKLIGITKIIPQDDTSFKAEIYDNINDTKPSAIVEVKRLSNIFSKAKASDVENPQFSSQQ
jgi:hypothetical protein